MDGQLEVFSEDAARSIPGPGWLTDLRGAAAARASSLQVPSTQLEEWRYSPIDSLELEKFAPILATGEVPAGVPAGIRELTEAIPAGCICVVLCNGRLLDAMSRSVPLPAGAYVGRLTDDELSESRFDAHERVNEDSVDIFSSLNAAFSPDPIVVRVDSGVRLEVPVVVINWIQSGGVASFTRLLVDVGDNAAVQVIEYQGGTDPGSLSVPSATAILGSGAWLEMTTVQRRPAGTFQIANIATEVGAGSTAEIVGVGLGASYARTRTHCKLVGQGATGRLASMYYGRRDQVLDYRTYQDHIAPDTRSDLLFKGVLDDDARSVYTGLIRVGKQAKGTDALQTNRNLKLSERAWAESVPNLEIHNNDVRCSHASTVGPVDEDQLFYLESRGVPTGVAERLLVSGFFAEVIDRLPDDAVRNLVEAELKTRLEERESR